MQMKDTGSCHDIISYISGECTELERAAFERHLKSCGACSKELQELRPVWDSLPYQMEEQDVPPDLKMHVMNSLRPVQSVSKRKFSLLWVCGLAAAVIFGMVLGVLWNTQGTSKEHNFIGAPLNQPAQVQQTFELKAADASMPLAKGTAWIIKNGDTNTDNIVMNLQGLKATTGDWTYQVWLINHGKKYNCGTFHVDQTGTGVLTYYIDSKFAHFEGMGVTLEADPNGKQPRGKKVLGT